MHDWCERREHLRVYPSRRVENGLFGFKDAGVFAGWGPKRDTALSGPHSHTILLFRHLGRVLLPSRRPDGLDVATAGA